MRVPAGPASIFDPGSGVSIGHDTVTFVTEIYNHSTANVDHEFPLSQAVNVDSVSGTWSYYGLNGRCTKNNTAIVANVGTESEPLLILDVQSQGQKSLN